MRIGTMTIYKQSLNSMLNQESAYLDVSTQLSSGKRVVNPSDDPKAASQAVTISQSLALNQQYADARDSTRTALSMEESALSSIGDAITSAKTLVIEAGNSTLSDDDRASLATELQGIYSTLLSLANSTDANGNYLFGGYQNSSTPFVTNDDGTVEYVGGDNVQLQQVNSSWQMASGDTGQQVFMSAASSSSYLAEAAGANSGSVTFTGPSVVDTTDASYGEGFTVKFNMDSDGNATYQVGTGDPVTYSAAASYESGQTLEVNGLSLTLDGTPADGDSISVSKAEDADPNIFSTLENLINVLNTPVETDADQANLQNTLSTSSRELDNGLDNVLTTRASVGSRLSALDTLDTMGDSQDLNYSETLSDLVDLDYASAISEYSLRQVGLQAAQKAFINIQGLSLFQLM